VPEGVGVELGAVLEAVQAVEAPGLVANGHIAGNALEAVLLGFVLTDRVSLAGLSPARRRWSTG